MAAFHKGSNGWQVRVRRKGFPEINRSLLVKKQSLGLEILSLRWIGVYL